MGLPDAVIRVHKIPGRNMSVPLMERMCHPSRHWPLTSCAAREPMWNMPTILTSATWCGGENDTRELSDFWVGETCLDKLLVPPAGYDIAGGDQRRWPPKDIAAEMPLVFLAQVTCSAFSRQSTMTFCVYVVGSFASGSPARHRPVVVYSEAPEKIPRLEAGLESEWAALRHELLALGVGHGVRRSPT